jgi:hypothetical protein
MGLAVVKVLSLFSGSLASRVATRLVESHPDIGSVHLLHFRSPFSREVEELRQLVKAEWPKVTFRTQSIKKDYQSLINLTDTGQFSLSGSCRRCQSLLLARAARYMERVEADYLVTGFIPGRHGLSAEDFSEIVRAEGLEGRVLSPHLEKRPLMVPRQLSKWAEGISDAEWSSSTDPALVRLADALGLSYQDLAGSDCRCKLTTPGFGERVAALFNEKVVTLNALCLLDFPMYMKADPDLQIVLAFDENEKRELQNYFLPQDLRVYPATPHGPMTLLRTNWETKTDSEKRDVVEFVARLTATYTISQDTATIPVYCRLESEDERQLMNVTPYASIDELEKLRGLELIPLELPIQGFVPA